MQKEEDKLLVRIAEMYYQEDKNQSQISKELNIHRSTISRLLKRSRNEGIVNISNLQHRKGAARKVRPGKSDHCAGRC